MTIEPGERRRRRELERARDAGAQPSGPVHDGAPDGATLVTDVPRQSAPAAGPVTPDVPHQASSSAVDRDRPVSRRELRDRDRRPEPPPMPGEPTTPDVEPASPPDDVVDHDDDARWTWRHALALAAVTVVLGVLVWSQTTHPSGTGALGVGTASPTTSPSAPPAAPRGEL